MRSRTLSLVLVAVLLLAPAYTLVAGAGGVAEVIVENRVGLDLYNYSVLVVLSTSNWPYWQYFSVNGSDIYFTDVGGRPLYYWVEVFNKTQRYARIWVKVPYIPAYGAVEINMHYGGPNPYPDYNDPRKVFMVYEDFSNTSVLADMYVFTHSASDVVEVVNGTLHVVAVATTSTAYGGVHVDWVLNITAGVEARFKAKWYWYGAQIYPSVVLEFWDGVIADARGRQYNAYDLRFFEDNETDILVIVNGVGDRKAVDGGVPNGTETTVIARWMKNGTLVFDNGFTVLRGWDQNFTYFNYTGFFVWVSTTGRTELYVDWFILRQYVDPEPSVTVIPPTPETTTAYLDVTVHTRTIVYATTALLATALVAGGLGLTTRYKLHAILVLATVAIAGIILYGTLSVAPEAQVITPNKTYYIYTTYGSAKLLAFTSAVAVAMAILVLVTSIRPTGYEYIE